MQSARRREMPRSAAPAAAQTAATVMGPWANQTGIASPGKRGVITRMTIGVPREVKIGETRVSMTPSLCRRVTSLGGKVLIEKGAGLSAGYTDDLYKAAGASFATTAAKVWKG